MAGAGADQAVNQGDRVRLGGTGSTDADFDALSYFWSLLSLPQGNHSVLSAPDVPVPTFTADRPGVYIGQFIVDDGALQSAPDTVSVAVNAVPHIRSTALTDPANRTTRFTIDAAGNLTEVTYPDGSVETY